jgi:hypothetical protein
MPECRGRTKAADYRTGKSGPSPVSECSGIGMLRYRTDIQDAGMPMPAASTSMPMPNYGKETEIWEVWEGGWGGGASLGLSWLKSGIQTIVRFDSVLRIKCVHCTVYTICTLAQ